MSASGTVRTEAVLGTLVTIEVVHAGAEAALDRAFAWFHQIEQRCTRFHPESELMQLCSQPGVALPASPILFESVQFAVSVAEATGGAFDPAVGGSLEARGFDREHRSGAAFRSRIPADPQASYRDIELDPLRRTITLRRPLVLDLGAVAKGLAIDTAARELASFRNFAIDAGGDLYLAGSAPRGGPWSVGIRNPWNPEELLTSLEVSDQAVCTSGSYERGDHILDGRSGAPAAAVASATVVAPGAMLADALATAAFVLGPEEGIRLLDRTGVNGLIVGADRRRHATGGLRYAA